MNIKPLGFFVKFFCVEVMTPMDPEDRNGVTGSKVLQKGRPETQGDGPGRRFCCFFFGVM